MAQGPTQAPPVRLQHPCLQALPGLLQAVAGAGLVRLEPARAEHRRQGQGHQQRHDDGSGQRQGELAEHLVDDAAHEQDGDEHHHQRQVHRQQGEADLAGTLERGGQRRLPVVDMPGDVLQHHDGIVHHQAGGKDQRHQRQHVEREPAQVHHRKGADQRHRHRQRGNQRAAPVTEEGQHQQDHQAHGNQQGALGLVQSRADHRRAVHGHVQLDAGRQHRLQGRQLGADLLDGLDDVGASLTVDHQQHRRFIVEETAVVTVLDAVLDLGHIGQAQTATVLITDQQRQVVGGLAQLVVGLHLPLLRVVLDKALGPALVGGADGLAHLIQRHAVLLQLLRLQLHAHRRQGAAANLHFAHAIHLGQALRQDGRGQVVQAALVELLGCQREHHNRRLRRIDLLVGRHAAHAARHQAARGIDGRLHFPRGAVDVLVLGKLHNDPGRALAGTAGDLLHAGNGAHGPLQRRGHAAGHDRRAGTGQVGLHHDHREIHLRQRRHRQQAEADDAQEDNGQAAQPGRHRTMNKRCREVHAPCSASDSPRARRASRSNAR